jgi:hypothetical protein
VQQLLAQDSVLTDLASLDVIDVGLEGQVLPNWRFFDEVLYVAADKHWSFRDACWAVIASRARRLGVRDQVDVDGLVEAFSKFLPWAMRARGT